MARPHYVFRFGQALEESRGLDDRGGLRGSLLRVHCCDPLLIRNGNKFR